MHAHRRRTVLAAVAALAVLTGACAVPAEAEETSSGAGGRAADPTVGAPGVGDPYFPRAGNGGIDVSHYDLRLDYRPPSSPDRLVGRLDGVAEIRLRTTQRLSRFNLDLRGLRASRVRVDGRLAAFSQADDELRIRPARTLAAGRTVLVRVAYAGRTGRPEDSSGALYGWVTTPDGAVVASEPDGASTWFPANDHPTDKARFDVRVRVPRGLAAISNGVLRERDAGPRRTTWTWRATDPMPAYLATVAVGDFSLERYRAAGVPVLDAVDRDLPASASRALRRTGEMLDFFEGVYGRYPFATYGAIVDDDELGYALETQTRSLFTGGADEATVAHELAHQWVGNHVGPARWSDIWLNEGWATYSEWLWDEHDGGPTVQSRYDEVAATPADDDLWSTRVADPGVAGLFEAPVYVRGAAALHALRTRVGDDRFFALARAWVTTYGGRTASTADLEALAERVTGEELTAFFDAWLRTPRKPAV